MATVNRFFNPRAIAQVNPVPLEQLALVPQYMRQQHNAIEAAAFENTILQADTLKQDSDIARQALSPIEQQSEEIINGLAKTGFSQEKRSELMKLLGTKKQVERDIIQPLESRKQSYLASVEEIKTALKDDPELMQNRLTQLNILNNKGASVDPDTGKLVVPGIENPLYQKRMKTKDMQEAYETAGSLVAERIKEQYLGPEQQAAVSKGADVWAVLEKQTLTSKQQDEIFAMMKNTIGSDVLNTIKMDIAVEMGPMSDKLTVDQFIAQTGNPYVAQRFNEEMTNVVLARKKANIVNSEEFKNIQRPEGKREYLEKEVAKYQQSEVFKSDLQKINEESQNKTALDFLTDISVEDKFKNISQSMAYANMELDRKYLDMGATESLRNKIQENGLTDYQTVDIEYANNESPFGINTEGIGLDNNGNINFLGNDVTLEDKFLREKGWNPDQLSTLDRKDIIEGKYRNDFKEFKKNNQEDVQKLKNIKTTVPYFRDMDNEIFLNTINQYKEASKSFVTAGVYSPKDGGKTFRNNYLGSRDSNNNIVLPKNVNTSTYSLNDGDADITLHNVADKLGYDDVTELIQTGGFSQATFVPNIGRWVATAVDSDGKPQNIFISPSKEIERMTEPSRQITNAITSMAPVTKLNSQSKSINAYVLNDYQNNDAFIVYTPENINPESPDSYNKLLNLKNRTLGREGFGAESNTSVIRAVDVLSSRASQLVQTKAFKDNIDVD